MLVFELTTNYVWRIPEEKLDDAIRGIEEVFQLLDNAKPAWYLEADIDPKEPNEYLLPVHYPSLRRRNEKPNSLRILVSFFEWSECH